MTNKEIIKNLNKIKDMFYSGGEMTHEDINLLMTGKVRDIEDNIELEEVFA